MYVEAEKQISEEKKCELADLHRLFLAALKNKPANAEPNWLTRVHYLFRAAFFVGNFLLAAFFFFSSAR